MKLSRETRALIDAALKEDLGARGDVTTELFVDPRARLSGRVVAKEAGVVCGVHVAAGVFKRVDRGCKVAVLLGDGRRCRPGDTIMRVSGSRALLTAERTALNFMQRMSGVATLTARYADALKKAGSRTKVYDTRKTLPAWRELDKYAVRCGGGVNHRMGLYDAVLVKDNHWAGGRDVAAGVREARRRYPGILVELEAEDLAQVERALSARPDVILLDNMTRPGLRRAIALIRRKASRTRVEVSGGVTLKTLAALGKLGADCVSVGRVTHSAPALDLSLEL